MTSLSLSGDQLKEILTPLVRIRDVCHITISDAGLVARVVDRGNVIFSELILYPKYFAAFAPPATPVTLLVDVERLNNIRVKKDDLVSLSIESGGAGQPWISMQAGNKYFKTRALTPNCSSPTRIYESPNFLLSHSAWVPAEEFVEAVTDIGEFADRFVLSYSDNSLVARTPIDLDLAYRVAPPHRLGESSATDEVKSVYSTDYINDICKVVRRYSEIQMCFSDDHPLKIHVPSLGQDPGSTLTILLAPKIPGEEEE
jgi:hypothetical protein